MIVLHTLLGITEFGVAAAAELCLGTSDVLCNAPRGKGKKTHPERERERESERKRKSERGIFAIDEPEYAQL